MIEISFCELSGILEKGIKGINNGEIEGSNNVCLLASQRRWVRD
ncbi:hypothetical protein EC180050_1307 [Escherichia coli 180050]|nr:hypothetical protein EC180050_1307 [Escherichia coli 180050]